MKLLTRLLAVLAVTLPAVAQSPCQQNLLVNGDFDSILPVWPVTGGVTASFASRAVNAIDTSRCLQLLPTNSGCFSVVAPAAVALQAIPYELSFDVLRDAFNAPAFELGLTTGGTRTAVGSQTFGAWIHEARVRVVFHFTPSTPGSYLLDLAVCTWNPMWIDNLVLHPARNPRFNVTHDDRRPGNDAFEIRGGASDFVAVFMAFGSTPPVTVPGCSGEVLIGPLPNVIEYVSLVSLDGSGAHTGALNVPAFAAGFRIWWQAVAITPVCALGCADMIAF
jgi:hypothetical protein